MALNLARLGRVVERYMLDTIRIDRLDPPALDPVSMENSRFPNKIYEGKAMVSPMGDPGMITDSGQRVYRVQYEIAIPLSAPKILPGDKVTVKVTFNEDFADRTLTVHDEIRGTFATHQRVKAYYDQAQP